MLHKLLSFICAFALIIVIVPGKVIASQENEVKVYLDGELMEFDVQPQIISGRTMVPMRKIFEALGANVKWYAEEQKILATKGEKGIWLQIENNQLRIVKDILSSSEENAQITLDVPPQLIDGRTLVPIRAVAESFDADVKWDEKSFSVLIITSVEDNSLETIKANGKLVIGCDDSFPPMSFKNENGDFVGFDVDLAHAVANKLGVDLEVKPISWDAKEIELNSNNIDAIWSGMTITSERMERILFSEPYLTNSQVFIVKSESNIIVKQNLMKKIIGYQIGSSSEEVYKKNPESNSFLVNTEHKEYVDLNSAVSALNDGEIDAVLVDKFTAQYRIKDSFSYRLIDGEYVNDIEEWGIGFRLNDETLRNAVQDALNDMFVDGTYVKIAEKWFGPDTLLKYTNNYSDLFGTHTTKQFSLLNNRLQVYLPEFSQDVDIQDGIMSPWSSSDEETRIFVEKDNKKLVLYLSELFRQASDNLTDDANTILITQNGSNGTLKSPTSNGKVSNVQIVPSTYEGAEGIVVREAIIKTQDGLLVYAAVLALRETFNSDKDGCIRMAGNLIESISQGERVIDRSQRTESIYGFNLSMNQNYVLTYQMGVDFNVYNIQKIVKPGELQPYMGVYVGYQPSFSAKDSTASVDGKILGQATKWYFDKETSMIDMDTQIDALVKISAEEDMYMHIFACPRTESNWNELKEIAESLVIAK